MAKAMMEIRLFLEGLKEETKEDVDQIEIKIDKKNSIYLKVTKGKRVTLKLIKQEEIA